jgi:hypothetical protein
MAKNVDLKLLNLSIANNTAFKNYAKSLAEEKLLNAKNNLIEEFSSHPVSQEIEGGNSALNSSGTLGGYGNLFSFIGFESNQNPVQEWIRFINAKIKVKSLKKSTDARGLKVSFNISVPSESDLVTNARMPWENGRSWILAIGRGISGFSYYVSKSLGRSGGGIQSSYNVRAGTFRRTKYWPEMWNNFIKNIKS